MADIAIRFSDPDFLKGSSNNLAIRRRFYDATLTFDPLSLDVCCRLDGCHEDNSELYCNCLGLAWVSNRRKKVGQRQNINAYRHTSYRYGLNNLGPGPHSGPKRLA